MNSGEDLFWDASQQADNSNESAQPSKSAQIQKSNSKFISSDNKSEKTHENDGNQVDKSAQSILSHSKSIGKDLQKKELYEDEHIHPKTVTNLPNHKSINIQELNEAQRDQSNPINVILAFHSTAQACANQIMDYFKENWKNFKIVMLTETVSNRMHVRMNLIQQCDCLVVVTTCSFQKNANCIEIVHFARSINKKMYGINFFYAYRPFGALGYILGNETELVQCSIDDSNLFNESLNKLANLMNLDKTSNDGNESLVQFSDRNIITPIGSLKYTEKSSCNVLIWCHEETLEVAQIIAESLKYKDVSSIIEDSSTCVTSIQNCKVLIVIMSSSYERNLTCRSLLDTARQLNKSFLLVFGEKDWKPFSWIKILTSGRECFRIYTKEQAYEKKYDDSTEIDSLTTNVIQILYPKTASYKEYDLAFVLKKNIEKCKSKLASWPPPKRNQLRQKHDIQENAKNFQFNTQEASRLKSAHSIGLRDIFSIYNKKNDCVLLYEKSILELVLKVNEELQSRQIKTWLNLNFGKTHETFATSYEPIANAIENSKVVLVFLNNNFQISIENKSEFEYAIKRSKAFIFLLTEESLVVENWIETKLNESHKYELFVTTSNQENLDDQKFEQNGQSQLQKSFNSIRNSSSRLKHEFATSAKSDWGDFNNF
jgi:hypothetical protein